MDNTVGLYSQARGEYLIQLSTWIIPPLVEFFRKEYDIISKKEGRRAMAVFQTFCSEVPRWNQDVIDINIGVILDNCRCDYVEELMTAVFIAHTKMLTAIRVSSKQKKLQITLPKLDHFLHRVFIECARAFWKAPFLFSDDLSPIEKQKNVLQAEAMCTDALSGAVRSLLPVKNILRDYLDEDTDSDSDTETPAAAAPAAPAPAPAAAAAEPVVPAIPAIPAAPIIGAPEVSVAAPAAPAAPAAAVAAVAAPELSVAAPAAPAAAVAAVAAPELSVTAPAPAPAPAAPKEPKAPVTIEKIDTLPESVLPTVSNHSVIGETKAPGVTLEKADENPNPPKLMIETERAVHFTPYDTVYDENTANVSEIRHTPKLSVEEKPTNNWGLMDDYDEEENAMPPPRLQIMGGSDMISADDIEDLDFTTSKKPDPVEEEMDMPLGSTGDFEVLA